MDKARELKNAVLLVLDDRRFIGSVARTDETSFWYA
jgi:hypothetical protein